MAEELKRVGMVFTADGAEDFKKELSAVKAAVKTNQAEFKLLKSTYDENTTSAQKLADKQKYLAGQVDTYSDQVRILTKQLELMEANESTSQASIEKKREELAKAKTQLNEYSDSLERVNEDLQNGTTATREAVENLSQELEKSSSALERNEAALRAQEAAYDKNTSITEKLGDQQEFLTQQTEIYRDQVENLERQVLLLSQSEDADVEALNKKQAELDGARAKLGEYEKKLKDVNTQLTTHSAQLKEWGDKLQGLGGQISAVGAGLTKGVTAPIAAIGVAAGAAWKEVDEAEDTIIKMTGATGDAAEDLQQQMNDIATSIPTSFQTAAEAVGEVNTRFGLTGDTLEDVAGKFTMFAELAGTGTVQAVDSAQSAMAAYGMSAEQVGTALDILTAAAQGTGESQVSLAESMTSNAVTLQQMGFSFEQSAGFISSLNKSGLDASAVMSGLSKAMRTAAAGGVPMSQALQQVQDRIANAKSETEGMQIATELFGKTAPQIYSAIANGQINLDAAANSMEDYGDRLQTTFEATLDPADEMTTTMNGLKGAGKDLAETAMTSLLPMAKDLMEDLKGLVEWFNSLGDGTKEAIVKFGLFAAAAGPVVSTAGNMVSGFGNLSKGLGLLSENMPGIISGFSSFGGVLTGTVGPAIATAAGAIAPFIPVIAGVAAGIAAAVGIGVVLYKNWDKIKEFMGPFVEKVKEGWGKIKDVVAEKTEGLRQVVSEKWQNITDAYTEHGGGLKGIVAAGLTAVKEVYTARWDAIDSLTGGKLSAMADKVKGHLKDITQKYTDTYKANGGGIGGIIAAGMEAARDVYDKGWSLVDKVTDGKLKGLRENFEKIFTKVHDTVKGFIEKVKKLFDFDWELPKLKLPHIKIDGKFSLNPPSTPKVSVDWYASAMNSPQILRGATIFGAAGGKLLGGGEAGAEVISGEKTLRDMIREESGGDNRDVLLRIAESLENLRPSVINVYGADYETTRDLARTVSQYIYQDAMNRGAAAG